MKKWYSSNIKNEILLWFFIVSILPLLFIFILYYFNLKSDYEQHAQKYLTQILNEKVKITNNYINNLKSQLETISLFPITKEQLKKYKKDFSTDKLKNIYQENQFFENLLLKYNYYDMFVIDTKGDVLYTVKKESDLYENLLSGPLKDSGLAWVFKKSKSSLKTEISTFSYYAPSSAKASFIATPIFDKNKIIGVLAFQISEKELFKMIVNYEGLGKSGEIVAGYLDKDGNIISAIPLRHVKDAFENSFVLQSSSKSNKKIPVREALEGKNGCGISVDYRDIKIYAAWKYVQSLGWGMVVKMDYEEIMQPAYNRALINLLILFFVTLFIVIAIIIVTKHIVTPVDILIKRVKSLSNNDTIGTISDERVELNNEIGTLFKTFNDMSKSLYNSRKIIKDYATELESKVELRTKELQISKDELEKTNEKMKRYLDVIDKYVITSSTDLDGIITEVSEAFCKISGYKKAELIGKKHDILRHPATENSFYEELWETITKGKIWHGEIKNLKKDGSYYWVDAIVSPTFNKEDKIEGYSSIRQDITDRKRAQKLSITDPLTKIYNRIHLEESFKEELNRAKRYKTNFSVILLDIDHFKEVNDTYGHDIGDEVLIDIAKILKQNIRATDILGRWGGEEFLIILPQTDILETGLLAEKLRMAIENNTFDKIGKKTCSFGVSEFKESDESSKNIVKRADNALYKAKDLGRNRVVISKE
ncbi:MAG: hypothetical protein A2513_01425 [Sulfurimonas sp. RIFOXYD12_FULL_33_39]|uniref:diguanylate cyclase n=1 Tax=unclassified Sulfurimonas TaxID=2623549 RepID=UPI0008D5D86C|nr:MULTISPECIES: diguanylate cyclase [unclassified Sulfurimonas]OHE10979.1 MAG: hypothetical protein A2513_01425 [Sulfurimonas sp. RIFOXYD12_FULL_33_39]OHE13252.1 MAG: hypothetical protein A2530_06760 [Sulfurimonas sp. RIFOXYD2_FULL_34_21]